MISALQLLNRRRLLRWIAAVTAGGLLFLGLSAWIVGGALLAPAHRAVGPAPADFPVVETTIESESGSKLATWYSAAENPQATVVLLHGLRANRESMLDRARLFRQAGYSIVMIDLQAHGESPGEHITVGCLERLDAQAAVRYARIRNPHHKIGVIGCSLGGAAALLGSPLEIDALVIESVYPTVTEAVHDRVSAQVGPLSHTLAPLLLCQLQPRLGVSTDDLCPIDNIDDIHCPLLIASGDADQHTPLAETQRMFETAIAPKQLVIFAGAAHVDLLAHDSQKYEREIMPFLRVHLLEVSSR